jgi:hypothetical protein
VPLGHLEHGAPVDPPDCGYAWRAVADRVSTPEGLKNYLNQPYLRSRACRNNRRSPLVKYARRVISVYDFCEAHADDGEGIEAYIDPDTAVMEMVRTALASPDRTVSYLVRDETGEIAASAFFSRDGVFMVTRSDGTLMTHTGLVEE